jgi:diguanylate cyclase (GGDEF)-like protein
MKKSSVVKCKGINLPEAPGGNGNYAVGNDSNLILQLNEALFMAKFMGAVNATLDPTDVCAIASRVLFEYVSYQRIVFSLSEKFDCRTFTISPMEERPVDSASGPDIPQQPLLTGSGPVRCHTMQLPEDMGKIEVWLDREATFNLSRHFLNTLTDNFAQALKNSLEFNRVKELAMRDGLTGLYNRRVFDEILSIEGALHKLMPLSLLILDLDDFKRVNDTFGHCTGDHVLATFARILRESCRGADLVARYGGEEFAVVLPATPSSKAMEIAQRMRMRFASTTFVCEDQHFNQTVSIGIACTYDTAKLPIIDLVHHADDALYRAKRGGKNRVCVHTGTQEKDTAKSRKKRSSTIEEAASLPLFGAGTI